MTETVFSARRRMRRPGSIINDIRLMEPEAARLESITIRTHIEPGTIGAIVALHGILYAREYGFDATFEAYVAGPLSEFVLSGSDRQQLWVAECTGRIVGCVAIVPAASEMAASATAPSDTAQLRWFLVDPAARGSGLGRRLLTEAVAFARGCGYDSIILWTVSALHAAAHLYTAVGFRRVEAIPGRHWGADVVEEKYEMMLR